MIADASLGNKSLSPLSLKERKKGSKTSRSFPSLILGLLLAVHDATRYAREAKNISPFGCCSVLWVKISRGEREKGEGKQRKKKKESLSHMMTERACEKFSNPESIIPGKFCS